MSLLRGAIPVACLGAAFALGTAVEPWFQTWQGFSMRQGSVLQALLGDSRRMFSNHFFLKADAYFHGGYYPSIFDNRQSFQTAHIAADAGAREEKNTGPECVFLGEPQDWIDAFSRKFFPSVHMHLDEEGEAGGKTGKDADEVREMLPWLRMSVELDPHRVESYMVGAYWLRERMGRIDEAEQFLREGLRANPDSYEILFELGRVAFDGRKDPVRARTMWNLATERWKNREAGKAEPDVFMLRQIISYRALLEEREGQPARAVELLKLGRAMSGGDPVFDGRIQRLEQSMPRPGG